MATTLYSCNCHPVPIGKRPAKYQHRNCLIRCSEDRRALFSRIAPVYDNLNDLLSLGQHRVWKRMAVSWSGAKKGDRVLDLCCGSGDLAFLLSEKVGINGQVIGLDFSREQLSVASSRQELKSKACYKNIEWVEGGALDLPFYNDYFDAVTMGYGLRNVIDKQKAMVEMLRVLKPGSKASVLDFNKSTQPFTGLIQFVTLIYLQLWKFNSYNFLVKAWMINNLIVPVATGYGLAEEYRYLNSSIQQYLTGNELEQLALTTGFSDAIFFDVAGGLMGNLVARR